MGKVGRPTQSNTAKIEGDFLRSLIVKAEAYMKEHKLNRTQMAKKLNMHPPVLSKIMKGGNVTSSTIQKLLDSMNMKADFKTRDKK